MDFGPASDGEIAVGVSTGRRAFGAATLGLLGALLLWLAVAAPPASLPLMLFLVACGIAATAQALRLVTATSAGLLYAGGILREAAPEGRVLARLEDIEGVDRGVFAFKPSNGFVLTLRRGAPGARGWAPGLWWRVGRRVGVGGAVRAAEARTLAEILALQVAARG